ncbi:MAG: tRNA pseudouridine(38-40) synthase TruA [Archangiaceae bacterium]|nr:tRNA pseudouridine(38-40) synthase TruA [Archangiaceae bacterium]
MPRIKLTLEYDGTHYVGWQIQENGPSVQGRIQRALAELLGESVTITGAGRTDSGVHALGQVAHFDSPRALPLKAYWMGLNGLLPDDIAVVQAEEVDPAFDARRWARGKRYRYRIGNRRVRSPMRRETHWEIFQPLDLEAMRAGAAALLGEHDFQSFRAADCQARHPVRKLRKVEVTGAVGDEIVIEVEGTAFLKHMVRNITGSLVDVGKSKHPPGWISQLLAAKDRTQAGVTAPAQGLSLVEVFYGDGPRSDDVDDE